ncbi:molybdopterin-guanine dinucleotide biosynthesis protein B, partial [Vibrio sp. 10N.261.48.A2]
MKDSKQRPNLPLLGFAAYSGTGKTTVLEALLPLLTESGLKVGVLKHAHHDFDVDKPGKDSYRLRKAGANQMLIASRNRHVMMTETPEAEADFDYLLTRFDTNTLDLILVEGCKNIAFPKIELHRDEVGKPWLYQNDDNI